MGDPVANPAPETARLYAAEWARFATWCRETRLAPLPASNATLAAHLIAAAPGLSRGALGRRRAAIGTMHRSQGLPIPLLDASTQAQLRALARPVSRRRRDPWLGSAGLVRLAADCPGDLAGQRDRALLLLAAATSRPGTRRETGAGQGSDASVPPMERVAHTALLGLDAEHVHFTAEGVQLRLRARSDEAEPSRTVLLARREMAASCPVRALERWLAASDTAFGPVFRKVDHWGNVEHARLAPDAWSRIIARRSGSPPGRRP